MRSPLRKVLIDSHVAAITIAIMIFFSLEAALFGLYISANTAALFFLVNLPNKLSTHTLLALYDATLPLIPWTLYNLVMSLTGIFAAWILSRWVYGVGPLRSLGSYRGRFSRKTNA